MKLLFIVLLYGVFFGGNAYSQTTDVFTSSGTFVVPCGVSSVDVICWGGGGGGAGDGSNNGSSTGYGGGGGGYTTATIAVTAGSSIVYTVGTGGAGGGGGNGSAGGNTTFSTVVGDGGTGGTTSAVGTGGSGSGGTTVSGQNGNAPSGVSGGAGGDSGNGDAGGAGGPSDGSQGSNGTIAGGGGGGSGDRSGSSEDGGDGARGEISVTYTAFSLDAAAAGTDQTLANCATTATLAGNTPSFGTGTWTCTSGCTGVSITFPNVPASGVTGLTPGVATTFTWTISDAGCTSTTDDVIITAVEAAGCWNYCTPDFSTAVYSIQNVTVAEINNTSATISGGTDPDHEDFTGICANMVPGSTYPITVNGTGLGTNSFTLIVYIDWNNDGDFGDANESVTFTASATNPINSYSGNIVVPAGAVIGATTMRVMYRFSTAALECNTTGNGQSEDYCVNVLPVHCGNGVMDADETQIDCGGVDCASCGTCVDGIQNGEETAIDCGGGTCPACGAESCIDGILNQDETGIDCGGVCPACPTAPDNCSDAETVTPDGSCQTGTTVGAGDSWTGAVGCQSSDGHPDVWYTFTSTGTNADFTITNDTQTDDIEIILVLPNCGSNNCTCPFALVGSSCGASVLTASFNVVSGQIYFYTISTSGTAGTFDHCVETNNNVAPGQDCNTAQTLCVDGGFSVGNLQNGTGAINESTWLSCASEQNTQWYTFSAATSGTFSAMIEPDSWTAPQTGDDYDFAMLDITTTGCAATATELACDFSGCRGSTGFSATAGAGFSQTGGTDYQNNNPSGPANCTGGPQWNTNTVNLTAGNTYAYMIQNYTGSTGGATITFGGTTSLVMDATFTGTIAADCYTYPVVINSNYKGTNWTYLWDFGDAGAGSYTVGSAASAEPTYLYATDGTYNVSFTMTNGAGCVKGGAASVTTGCPLPVSLIGFSAQCIDNEVKVDWTTMSEINNTGFTIQRSSDGKMFQNIGEVDGAGNSVNAMKYQFTDENSLRTKTYYRLKQSDFDGKSSYSEVIFVEPCGEYGITVLPNPSKGIFNIVFDDNSRGNYNIVLFDITGKKILEEKLTVDKKNNKTHTLNIESYDKGIYILNVSDNTGSINLKVITE